MATIIGLLLCAGGVGVGIYSNSLAFRMLDEVNAQSPRDQRIGFLFIQLKMERILSRHRELMPASTLESRIRLCDVVAVVLFFGGFFVLTLGNMSSS
jgi:hypothetical protein